MSSFAERRGLPGMFIASQKMVTRDFLSHCSDTVREVFEYWDRQRGKRPMPRRADIDPIDLRLHLPHILLIDVQESPERFTYRLVGTEEVQARGNDPTGQDVASHFFGPSREDVLGCYRYVRDHCGFLFDLRDFVSADGRPSFDQTLFLPLSEDGNKVSQVLVYARPKKP